MTKDEKSLLLFLETQASDNSGRVKTVHMNESDMEIARGWNQAGFVEFGRIQSKDVNSSGSHWCKLSDAAWAAVHKLRQERAVRMWNSRTFSTTDEKRRGVACT